MSSSTEVTNTHLSHFRSVLQEWQQKQAPSEGFASTLDDIARDFNERLYSKGGAVLDGRDSEDLGKDVTVAFRTRPPLENEAAEKFVSSNSADSSGSGDSVGSEEPVAFCEGITVVKEQPGVFVAHVPGVKWNGPTLSHKSFEADLAFGPNIDNEQVYQRTIVANDLLPLVLSGGVSCILAYGQTGAGKTFTMEGLEHRIARDLFSVAKVASQRFLEAERGLGLPVGAEQTPAPADVDGEIFEFDVTFLELLGKHAADLLEVPGTVGVESNEKEGTVSVRKEIAIREDRAGDVHPQVISTPVRSSNELEELINKALSHRRTSATLRNATSSRSHAVLTIRVRNKLMPYAQEGQLILVDLAGSERYDDSKAHDKQRMDESRENNKSLMNLKECVRAKAKMAAEDGFVHIPWRTNKLTMLLKPIFDVESRQHSKTVVIAHVSPHIQDTIHSVNTLSYASPFKTSPPKQRGSAPYDPTDPRTWNHEQTISWFREEFAKPARVRKENERKEKEKRAALAGKKLKQPNPANDEQLESILDVEKLCPGDMTARNFGRMYTADFVERCLVAAAGTREDGTVISLRQSKAATVKAVALDVASELFSMMMRAKTRTRNEVMKSRKKIVLDETYGESHSRTYDLGMYTDKEIQRAQKFYGRVWDERMDSAMDDVAISDTAKELIEAWKAKGEPRS